MTNLHKRLGLLVSGVVASIVLGCQTPAERGQGRDPSLHEYGAEHSAADHVHGPVAAHDHYAASLERVLAAAGHSIYHLDDTWLDQSGRERRLGSLYGRPQVITMVYLSCGHACPRLLLDLKRIEAEIGEEHDVGFVMISIDPVRDTPDRLAEYAAGARLDPRRWTLLTADDRAARGLAALLGVRYRAIGEGEFSHSNVITVLDEQGVVVHRQVGLGEDPARTLAALRRLAGAKES